MTFNTELTELRLETYWDALRDRSIESVEWACYHAVKYFQPSRENGRFPVPALLREYVAQYRDEKLQRAEEEAHRLLPQWSPIPDEEGVEAIRKILDLLGDSMPPKHDAYQRPTEETHEQALVRLREQTRQVTVERNGQRDA